MVDILAMELVKSLEAIVYASRSLQLLFPFAKKTWSKISVG